MPAERALPRPRRGLARLLFSLARGVSRVLAAYQRAAARDGGSHHLAAERSHLLLLACLTPAQRREFERTRGFTVCGASGRLYRIGFGTVANIDVVGASGQVLYRLCAKPDDVPTPAVMLSQKLMLETREAEFLRIAVRHPLLTPVQGWQAGGQLRALRTP